MENLILYYSERPSSQGSRCLGGGDWGSCHGGWRGGGAGCSLSQECTLLRGLPADVLGPDLPRGTHLQACNADGAPAPIPSPFASPPGNPCSTAAPQPAHTASPHGCKDPQQGPSFHSGPRYPGNHCHHHFPGQALWSRDCAFKTRKVSSWIFSDCGFVLLRVLLIKHAFTRTGANIGWKKQYAPSLGASVATQGWPQAPSMPWHGSAVMVTKPHSSRQEDSHRGENTPRPVSWGGQEL